MLARHVPAVVVAAALALLGGPGCVYARILYYNVPSLAAPGYFDARTVPPSPSPVPLRSEPPGDVFHLPPSDARYRSFDDFLERNGTRAFLAIRDDRVVYERYFGGVGPTTLLPGFSVSKTVAALLVGCAVSDGLLGPVERRIADYVPEVRARPGYDRITIDELLRMTPGIDFAEASVNGAVLYYATDLRDLLYSFDVRWEPGTRYLYGSISTEILWDLMRRRLGGETVSAYFARRVWDRLGAEHGASWSLDSAGSGAEKLFGGFNATARDHARLGLLYLHRGAFAGRRVVPEEWVDASLSPDPIAGRVRTTDGWVRRARYEWFLTIDGRAYFAKGYSGQYVFVVPDRRTVFVRFGEGYGDVDWCALFLRFADGLS